MRRWRDQADKVGGTTLTSSPSEILEEAVFAHSSHRHPLQQRARLSLRALKEVLPLVQSLTAFWQVQHADCAFVAKARCFMDCGPQALSLPFPPVFSAMGSKTKVWWGTAEPVNGRVRAEVSVKPRMANSTIRNRLCEKRVGKEEPTSTKEKALSLRV